MDAALPSLSHRRPVADMRRLMFAFMLALFAAAAVVVACGKDVRHGFDEVAHASYIADLQRGGAAWPALDRLRMLDPTTMRFTEEANYLNHPPPFYAVLAALGPTLENRPDALLIHRLLNAAIAVAALAAMMALGLAADFKRLDFYAYSIPLVFIPVLTPLAGSINNDNAAFAGGALATLAAYQLLATGRSAWLALMLSGMIAAAFAKLTGLFLVGGFVALVLAYLIWRGCFERGWAVPVLIAGLLAAAPYLVFIAQYGSPAPDTAAQIAHMEHNARTYGWQDTARLSFPTYAASFLALFIANWMPVGPRNLFPMAMLIVPIVAVLCGIAGFAVSFRRLVKRNETPCDIVVLAGGIAIAATLACHIVFSYGRHLATGSLLDAYPRYYLPLAVVVPLAGLSLLSAVCHPPLRSVVAGFLIMGPILFGIFGAPPG